MMLFMVMVDLVDIIKAIKLLYILNYFLGHKMFLYIGFHQRLLMYDFV